MHSCSVATGDNYLHGWVPDLLSAMNGKKAALMLIFDEAYTDPPYISLAFAGPSVKLAYKSTVEYTHYSLAKLIEDVWGGGDLGQNDVNANSPVEFFLPGGPDFSLSAKPASVTFNAGSSATSVVSLASTGGFNGTVDLTTASTPIGVTTVCSPSSLVGNASATCTMNASSIGSYTATITGTSGSLTHATSIDVTVTPVPIPDFSLLADPTSLSFVAGQSATLTIQLQPTNGFNGAVDLSAESSPSGLTTICTPSSLHGSDTSTCTIGGSVPGTYAVVVTGTDGSLSHNATTPATMDPQPQPDFSLWADPDSVSL